MDATDEARHPEASVEEWLFACWTDALGLISGYRIVGSLGWYWAALARPGEPVVHITEWAVPRRLDPLLVKADGLWAEHTCVSPMEQWTVANEACATALEHPEDALGRAYGVATAVAFDLEWYATGPPVRVDAGYQQAGVVHGLVEQAGVPALVLEEAPAHRWHRWGVGFGPVRLPEAFAHVGARAPFAFPDGTVSDWTHTPEGWRSVPARHREP